MKIFLRRVPFFTQQLLGWAYLVFWVLKIVSPEIQVQLSHLPRFVYDLLLFVTLNAFIQVLSALRRRKKSNPVSQHAAHTVLRDSPYSFRYANCIPEFCKIQKEADSCPGWWNVCPTGTASLRRKYTNGSRACSTAPERVARA